MNSCKLGQSDLNITPIGIGAWAIGGGQWEFGWGAQNDQKSIDAIRTGLDLGINWIDTAAAYGLGHSETVVGHAVGGLRRRPTSSRNAVWSGTTPARSRIICKPHPFSASAKPVSSGWESMPLISTRFTGPPGKAPRSLRLLGRLKKQSARWRNSGIRERSATSASPISMCRKCSAPSM
jgi:hypothetical protein